MGAAANADTAGEIPSSHAPLLFQTYSRATGQLTGNPLPQANAYAMIQRRARAADRPEVLRRPHRLGAVDPQTKLVPTYLVGKRDLPTATAFIADLNARLDNRIQLTSDALAAYVEAVEAAFGADVDYGQAVKFYDAEPAGAGRYSPPTVIRAERTAIVGAPDRRYISTSITERQNLTMRMSRRRFTRLTNAFSKKVENHRAAVALHFAHYNLVRLHSSLRVTPAMAANVESRLWSLDKLVDRTSA